MGQFLHGCAKTTIAVRKEIQESNEKISTLAKKFGLAEITVRKWRNRDFVEDVKSGTKSPNYSISKQEQEIAIEFRKRTKLPLDECYIALKPEIPKLSRSALHRLYQKNGISKLPKEFAKQEKQAFKDYDIGFVHIDVAFLNIGKEKIYLFVAIERSCKVCFAKLYKSKSMENSQDFLQKVIEKFPFKIHRILTDNGAEFTYKLLQNCKKEEDSHPFNQICIKHNIKHKTIQFRHPWTNGQVEIMNKQIKNNTVKRYHYDNFEQLESHLHKYLQAYNLAKRLTSLKYLTPYQKMFAFYKQNKDNFKNWNKETEFLGLNNYI